jgi:hypothetical protein
MLRLHGALLDSIFLCDKSHEFHFTQLWRLNYIFSWAIFVEFVYASIFCIVKKGGHWNTKPSSCYKWNVLSIMKTLSRSYECENV